MLRIKVVLVGAALACSMLTASLFASVATAAPAKKPCVQQTFRSGWRSKDNCIAYIQNMLNMASGAKLKTDNKFDSKTKAAVVAWQTEEMIQVDGIVGPETWGTLCATEGDSDKDYKTLAGCDNQLTCFDLKFSTSANSRYGECVEYVQSLLNLANNAKLTVDGKFGPKTKTAVKDWQKRQKATDKKMKIDGVVGPQTWKTICKHKMPKTASQAVYDSKKESAGCK